MSENKTDMLAAVMEEFELHTLAYIGEEEDFGEQLAERVGEREIKGPGEAEADCVFLDKYGEEPGGSIALAYSKVKEGGFLLGADFNHKNIDVMDAVAEIFNLMLVQVGPCSVWCIRK